MVWKQFVSKLLFSMALSKVLWLSKWEDIFNESLKKCVWTLECITEPNLKLSISLTYYIFVWQSGTFHPLHSSTGSRRSTWSHCETRRVKMCQGDSSRLNICWQNCICILFLFLFNLPTNLYFMFIKVHNYKVLASATENITQYHYT